MMLFFSRAFKTHFCGIPFYIAVMPATKLYGLIGYPLGHSFSPAYFSEKFAREEIHAKYEAYPLERIEQLTALLADNPHILGLNVTTPYKEAVIPFLDALHPAAEKVGAVNCIDIRDGKLTGYNTDVIGFEQSLKPLLTPEINSALVLGSGGAAKAVCYVLEQLSIAYTIVSRTAGNERKTYAELTPTDLEECKLIVNTTILGMYPAIDTLPALPYEYLTARHVLYDLVYNPAETKFLQKGIAASATVKNGQEMLELQAEAAWSIWNL